MGILRLNNNIRKLLSHFNKTILNTNTDIKPIILEMYVDWNMFLDKVSKKDFSIGATAHAIRMVSLLIKFIKDYGESDIDFSNIVLSDSSEGIDSKGILSKRQHTNYLYKFLTEAMEKLERIKKTDIDYTPGSSYLDEDMEY